MVDMTRESQRDGDFTDLEISQKKFHDSSIELNKKQLELIEDQKEYGKTITRATWTTAVATMVVALVMLIQYLFPIREVVYKPDAEPLQAVPPTGNLK